MGSLGAGGSWDDVTPCKCRRNTVDESDASLKIIDYVDVESSRSTRARMETRSVCCFSEIFQDKRDEDFNNPW